MSSKRNEKKFHIEKEKKKEILVRQQPACLQRCNSDVGGKETRGARSRIGPVDQINREERGRGQEAIIDHLASPTIYSKREVVVSCVIEQKPSRKTQVLHTLST